jgi:hypothetical protein
MIIPLPQALDFQELRLQFIDLRLALCGEIARKDLMLAFTISAPAAAKDLSDYSSRFPQNAQYQPSKKLYQRTKDFQPSFNHDTRTILDTLQRIHQTPSAFFMCEQKSIIPIEAFNLPSHAPTMKDLSALSTAIHTRHAVKTEYSSLNKESEIRKERTIVPHSFFFTGFKWYIRAYSRKDSSFRSYTLNRFTSIQEDTTAVLNQETQTWDDDWNRFVTLIIVPHPKLETRLQQAIVEEYSMTLGNLKLRTRSCMAGMILRFLGVDCSPGASLDPEACQLHLQNFSEISNVPTAFLAPGFPKNSK